VLHAESTCACDRCKSLNECFVPLLFCQGNTNGSEPTNVLELMKQWKDELTVNDGQMHEDDGGSHAGGSDDSEAASGGSTTDNDKRASSAENKAVRILVIGATFWLCAGTGFFKYALSESSAVVVKSVSKKL